MTPIDMTQMQLAHIAELALELRDLDGFLDAVAKMPGASELRALAVAVAEVQRVAHRQLSSAA